MTVCFNVRVDGFTVDQIVFPAPPLTHELNMRVRSWADDRCISMAGVSVKGFDVPIVGA